MPVDAAAPPPDAVRAQVGSRDRFAPLERVGVRVDLQQEGPGLRVDVSAAAGVSRVALRWRRPLPEGSLVLGDAWERSYGDLSWQPVVDERTLPWSVLLHHPATGTTRGLGVRVRGGALALFTADPDGVTLWLNLRSGGSPVLLGDRVVTAAVVRAVEGGPGDSAFAVQRALAAVQCTDPLPVGPLVGANNWYYAYGRGFGLDAVVRDARTVSDLASDHPVRPFGVIDDGWSVDGVADGRAASGGP